MVLSFAKTTLLLGVMLVPYWASADNLPEIQIISSVDESIKLYSAVDYWGDLNPGKILEVPPYFVVATTKVWQKQAAALPVSIKKELFYRSLLPLVLYANDIITADRNRLLKIAAEVAITGKLASENSPWLTELAIQYRLLARPEAGMAAPTLPRDEALNTLVSELMRRVDIIPPALALGQGAYESGYGTSRFALEGSSYFGQWTYGGKGMAPKQKRAHKGNYGVAAYDWPLDSVHSYMLNLNTHRAYADLRARRAKLRTMKEPVTGLALVPALSKYSERGMEYVDTLSGIIRVNKLAAADEARLLDMPVVLIVDAASEEDRGKLAAEIESLRISGELSVLIDSMGVSVQ